jgi:hypothetical protein
MSDARGGPPVDQSVNHELDWLRDIYRILDPRSNRVTREGLERALVGLDVDHLSFVRDLNSAILEDQLEVIGGCPESYEQISLYTDYIIVDSFLTQLIGDAGTNAVAVTPEKSHSRHSAYAHAELNRGFAWEQVQRHTIEKAHRPNRKRRLKHYASKLWRRPSRRRPLKLLLVIFVLAVIEQSLERYAPYPVGPWTRNVRSETVEWLIESLSHDTEPTDYWLTPDIRGVSPVR